MSIDPVTREVIRGWLDTAAEEMQAALIKTAHSMLIAEGRDATAALFDRNGRTIAQAASIPVHLGVMVELGRRIAARFPADEALPGDLYVTNDPYGGGTHLPDIAVASPVFHAGSLVGYALTMAHHRDIGGFLPGSVSLRARDLQAEGLRVPLIRLARAGTPCTAVHAIIEAASRTPRSLRGDIGAQVAGCRTGERRLAELFARWPAATIDACVESLLDYSERLTRQAIGALPRGRVTFTDHLDDDGLDPLAPATPITVSVEARGEEIEFDFTGSAPQVAAAINNVAGSTTAIVYYAARTLVGDSVPNNDGCYRPVRVRLPPDSIVNASPPAPVGSRGVALKRIEDVVLGALARLVPARMPAAHSGQYTIVSASGRDTDGGEPLVGHFGGPYAGGNGAQPARDGFDCSDHGATNGTMVTLEDAESRLPLLFHRLQLWTDSGGAGRLRGGLGYEARVEWRGVPITATLRRERMRFVPQGLAGGGAAPPCRTSFAPRGEPPRDLPGKIDVAMSAGDVLHYWTTGGAGREDASTRDPQRVLDDVLDGRVSPERARDSYRVVVTEGRIDHDATRLLRAGAHPPQDPARAARESGTDRRDDH
jgi:N-methylhydantoinase B/oxoprolinase/acetone carboxylase alpha subunit